jgi:hypothetical protein
VGESSKFGHMKNIQHLAKSNEGEKKHKGVSNQSKGNAMLCCTNMTYQTKGTTKSVPLNATI